MSGLFLLIFLLAVALSRLRSRFLTPAILFTGIWLGMVCFYALDPYLFQFFTYRVPRHASLYRLMSLAAFVGGTILVWIAVPPRVSRKFTQPARLKIVARILIVLFASGTMFRLGSVVMKYGNPIAALPQIREDFVHGSLLLPGWTKIATVFGNLAALDLGVLFGLGDFVVLDVLALLGLAILNDSATGDKGGMRLIVFFALAAYYSTVFLRGKRFRNYTRYLVMGACAFGAYSLITYLRVEGGEVTVMRATFGHFYLNIVGNLPSSAWFLDHPWPAGKLGAYSFPGFYELIGKPALETGANNDFFNADIVGVGIYNTSDFIAYLSADFGAIGVAVASGIAGAVSAAFFLRAKYLPTTSSVASLALIAGGLVLLVRGFYFGAPGFWLTWLALSAQNIALGSTPGAEAVRSASSAKPALASGGMDTAADK
jgi:oligosaccharide repeat unit polymerase